MSSQKEVNSQLWHWLNSSFDCSNKPTHFVFCLCDIFFYFAYLPGKDAGQEHGSRRMPKKVWSNAEIAAVMRHFRDHICKGKLATKNECSPCKLVEDPVLAQRTVQNIRDFVRNRGTAAKRQSQKQICKPTGYHLFVCVLWLCRWLNMFYKAICFQHGSLYIRYEWHSSRKLMSIEKSCFSCCVVWLFYPQLWSFLCLFIHFILFCLFSL